jgi:hypothetical protein
VEEMVSSDVNVFVLFNSAFALFCICEKGAVVICLGSVGVLLSVIEKYLLHQKAAHHIWAVIFSWHSKSYQPLS